MSVMRRSLLASGLLLASTALATAQILLPTVGATGIESPGVPVTSAADVGGAMTKYSARAGESPSILDLPWRAACNGGDDSIAVYNALTALRGTGAKLHVPASCSRLTMGPAARLAGLYPLLDGVGLIGDVSRDSGGAPGGYGGRGGTILLTDTGGPPFLAGSDWSVESLTFYWPNQTEAYAVAHGGTPQTYPPLISGISNAGAGAAGVNGSNGRQIVAGTFSHNQVINPWDVLDFGSDLSGGLTIENNRVFPLDNFVRLGVMAVESTYRNNDVTPNAFYSALGVGVGPTYNLRNYAATHASQIQAVGGSVDGLQVTGGYSFGIAYGLRASGGTFNLLSVVGSGFDAVTQVLSVESGGWVVNSQITGGVWYIYTFGAVTQPKVAAVTVASTSTANGSLQISGVSMPSADGGLIDWEAAGGVLSINDIEAPGMNNTTSSNGSGIRFNSAGGRLRVTNGTLGMLGGSSGDCIDVPATLVSLLVEAVAFNGCGSDISLGGATPTPNAIVGNVSTATVRSHYEGSQAGYLMNQANVWDR